MDGLGITHLEKLVMAWNKKLTKQGVETSVTVFKKMKRDDEISSSFVELRLKGTGKSVKFLPYGYAPTLSWEIGGLNMSWSGMKAIAIKKLGIEQPTKKAKEKAIKCWNGRPYGLMNVPYGVDMHVYIGAYSIADARRLCLELGLYDPGYREIKEYFSETWGNAMNGIKPERGIWIQKGHNGKPERVTGKPNFGDLYVL